MYVLFRVCIARVCVLHGVCIIRVCIISVLHISLRRTTNHSRENVCMRPIIVRDSVCVGGWVHSRVAACRTGVLLAAVVVLIGLEVHLRRVFLRRDVVRFLVPVRESCVCVRLTSAVRDLE